MKHLLGAAIILVEKSLTPMFKAILICGVCFTMSVYIVSRWKEVDIPNSGIISKIGQEMLKRQK